MWVIDGVLLLVGRSDWGRMEGDDDDDAELRFTEFKLANDRRIHGRSIFRIWRRSVERTEWKFRSVFIYLKFVFFLFL